MLRRKLFITCLVSVCLSAFVFGADLYDAEKQGTYIPEVLYEKVTATGSYYEGIQPTWKEDYYTVLAVKPSMILSNIKFHDQYAVFGPDFSFEKSGKNAFLTDNKTNIKYRKISDSSEYYDVYEAFLLKNVLQKLDKKDFDFTVNKDSTISMFDTNWKIDKDQFHYSEGLKLIVYCTSPYKNLGIIEKDGVNYLTTLDSPYDLVYVPENTLDSSKIKKIQDIK